MKIIVFGPQGSGKGTQAEIIARRHGLAYISTGDIFRYNIKNNTSLGQQAAEFIKQGNLAPDDLTDQIVQERLAQSDCAQGFVLDGYPRTQVQQEFLHQLTDIDVVIAIELSDEVAITRLSKRMACKCGLNYHQDFNPPKQPGICDKCGSKLFHREDDYPEAISKRLGIYHQQTEPLLEKYRQEGKLRLINGDKSITEVSVSIKELLSAIIKE
jgi:adenylate kinase